MFYQQNPVFAGALVIVFIGLFLFFKLRKRSDGSGSLSFFSGRSPAHKNPTEDWMLFLMAQQFTNQTQPQPISKSNASGSELSDHQQYIDNVKEEVLELLRR